MLDNRKGVNNMRTRTGEIELEGIAAVPKIKAITINNKGIIKKAKMNFIDGLNIIKGKNASGKTTVIDEIYKTSHKKRFEQSNNLSCGARIVKHLTDISCNRYKCFLIDDVLGCLNEEDLKTVLKTMSESKNQIIITLPDNIKIPKVKANIINTKDFELKD